MASACPAPENVCGICEGVLEYSCLSCGDQLCARCKDLHAKSNASKYHFVVPWVEPNATTKTEYCPEHETEEINLYCRDCLVPLCVKCTERHADHTICAIDIVVEEKRREMISEQEAMIKKHEELCQMLEFMEKNKEDYIRSVQKAQNDIENRAAEMRRQIDQEYKESMTTFHQLQEIQMAKYENRENELNARYSQVTEVAQMCRDELEKDDPASLFEFMQSHPELEELSKVPELEEIPPITYTRPQIDPDAISRCFGELVFEERKINFRLQGSDDDQTLDESGDTTSDQNERSGSDANRQKQTVGKPTLDEPNESDGNVASKECKTKDNDAEA